MCRRGAGLGIDYRHCMACNACLSINLAHHKCRERSLESDCPICHDFMFTSATPIKALVCGHFMHTSCFTQYTRSAYTCPICCRSLGDMSAYFSMIDNLLAQERPHGELEGRTQQILCNDCTQRGTALQHWVYHKCGSCGSYNTKVLL